MTTKNMSVSLTIGNAAYSYINHRVRYATATSNADWIYHRNRILLEDAVINNIVEAIYTTMRKQTKNTNI
jgi:hypothetical protein